MVPRTVGVVLHLGLVVAAGWIFFGRGAETVGDWFGRDWQPGNLPRRAVLFSFAAILWCRLTLTAFWLLRRRFDWGEFGGVLLACVVYQLGYALLGATEEAPLDALDLAGVGLYLFGSWLNTWSEIQRKRFKENPANRGRLFTAGLFRYARHINYFGDTLWVTGWALLTRDPWSAVIPLVLTASFLFVFIPMLSTYLKQKYDRQYDEWARTTKAFIPFVW